MALNRNFLLLRLLLYGYANGYAYYIKENLMLIVAVVYTPSITRILPGALAIFHKVSLLDVYFSYMVCQCGLVELNTGLSSQMLWDEGSEETIESHQCPVQCF